MRWTDDDFHCRKVGAPQPPVTAIIAGSEKFARVYLLSAEVGGVALQERRRHQAPSDQERYKCDQKLHPNSCVSAPEHARFSRCPAL
jgi:hypothetical protein